MTIEEMEAWVRAATADGHVPRRWRIAMSVAYDLIRYAPGGAALVLSGDGVHIVGLPVEIGDIDEPGGIALQCDG